MDQQYRSVSSLREALGLDPKTHAAYVAAEEARLAARRPAAGPAKMVRCSCGHTVAAVAVAHASLGTACPECYDRLSA